MKKLSNHKNDRADGSDCPTDFLDPGEFIDSDDTNIVAFAKWVIGGAPTNMERAIRLYYAVRDEIRYDPYMPWTDEDGFRASVCLERKRGFCIPKAALLAACARAVGIPTRIAFADVPAERVKAAMLKTYGHDAGSLGDGRDFAKEARNSDGGSVVTP